MANYRKPKKMPKSRLDLGALPALAGLVIGLFLAYFVGEALLSSSVHPLHWVVAMGGASLGYLLGLFYTMVRIA